MLEAENKISRHILDSIQDFLIYVDITYQCFNPYIKGIPLNVNGWRHEEGWNFLPSHIMYSHCGVNWDIPTQGDTGPLYV